MGLSLRAYARHRADNGLPGASLQAVQRARDRGRITLEPDGSVDPERADREWAANTDLSEAPVAVVAAHARLAAPAPGRTTPPTPATATEPVAVLGASLAENNAAKVYWQARQAELKFRQAAGELVPVVEVRRELETKFRTCRTRLLGIPTRAAAELPELGPTGIQRLESFVREALEELAEGKAGT